MTKPASLPTGSMELKLTEHETCSFFAGMIRLAESRGLMPGVIWCHVPNETSFGPRAIGKLLQEGVKPGFADYIFCHSWKSSVFIEMKGYGKPKIRKDGSVYQRPGTVKANQLAFKESVEKAGMKHLITYSAKEAIGFLVDCQMLSGEVFKTFPRRDIP